MEALLLQIAVGVQQRPVHGADPVCQLRRGAAVGLGTAEFGGHGLHFGIEVVQVVQEDRLGDHGQLRRAELVFAVVAEH